LIRSLFLVTIFLSFFGLGMAAPFVLTLGYVWVDTFRPQDVAWGILNQMPVAMIMGVAALGSYFLMDRRSPPRLTLTTLLTLLMAGWMTATMFWAEVPLAGWSKWDWAFKTVMFSAFIPLVIRSRAQIEALAQVYVFSLAANFIPFAGKMLLSGGGYGRNLGLMAGNGNLSEGGLLSIAVLMTIPLSLHLSRHTQLLPRTRLVKLGYIGLAGFALLTALGTYERSALVGIVALGGYLLMRSRHKLVFGLCLAVIATLIVYMMSATWHDRIDTISVPTADSSALMRLLVWSWTLRYAVSHPFGGGFNCFLVDRLEFPDGSVVFGHAFESSYFEMLGEQGWVGLGLFLGVVVLTFFALRRLARRTRRIPHLVWCADMSDALQAGMVVFLTSGAFLDVGFQPEIWFFVAMSVSLREYVRRVEQQAAPAVGWRARALPVIVGTATSAGAGAPWRLRPAWSKPGH
jgi:probable O-glycosylation ligase (exosortase A-associated)